MRVVTAAAASVACAAFIPSAVRAISAGTSHSCAVLEDGELKIIKCWGDNWLGQLGQGDNVSRGGNEGDMGDNLDAVPLGGVNFEPASVTSGNSFNCALSVDGDVKCWGQNNFGQLGLGDTTNRGGPTGTSDMGDNLPTVDILGANYSHLAVESVVAGGSSACAVVTGGLLKCWGWGSGGQLGLEDAQNRGDEPDEMGDNLEFVNLGTGVTVEQVAVGAKHACAVIENGFVKCWGNNDGGQLGYENRVAKGNLPGTMGDDLPLVDLGEDQRAVAVAAGFFHTCALLYVGDVKCWGFGSSGQLGQGTDASIGDAQDTMGDILPPIDLGTGRTAISLGLGGSHTCVVLDDETVKCWGANNYGTLGLGDQLMRGAASGDMGDFLPALDLTFGEGLGGVSNVFAGTLHTCVSGTEGGMTCFGLNANGQLGAETPVNLGDDPGETASLSSIYLGEGMEVVAPPSPWSTFNTTGDVAPGGSVPAPSPSQNADATTVSEDDGTTPEVAIASVVGLAGFFVILAVCCYWCRREGKAGKAELRKLGNKKEPKMATVGQIVPGDSPSKPKFDMSGNSKRVHFESNSTPDVDVHPLLKGVQIDSFTTVPVGDAAEAVEAPPVHVPAEESAVPVPSSETPSGTEIVVSDEVVSSTATRLEGGESRGTRVSPTALEEGSSDSGTRGAAGMGATTARTTKGKGATAAGKRKPNKGRWGEGRRGGGSPRGS